MSSKMQQHQLLFFPKVHKRVFPISALLIVGFIIFGAFFNEQANALFGGIQTWFADTLGWAMIIEVNIFVIATIYLAFGKFGDIRLGRMTEKPAYDLFSWTAMLFSAGIGIGLIYWGVAEPLYHYFAPPMGDPETEAAAKQAMVISFLHWGFHGWAIYAIVALALAYFHFRKGLPLTIRSALYPLLGDKIYGPWGDAVDILAVFGTMFGIVTSLGLGAMQINSGLGEVFGIGQSVTVQIIIIALITLAATISVVAGLDGGIKRLSNLNVSFSLLFLLFLLIVGPTVFIFDLFVQSYGDYLANFVSWATWTEAYTADGTWQNGWTIFYWAWWISWSPFVGVFVARISRGRTIREFLLGVMLLPTSIMFFWFSAFGGTALNISLGGDPALVDATRNSYGDAMFALLQYLPGTEILSGLTIILIVLWFVTSSDSGSFVIDMLTAGGDPNPPKVQRIFWAVTEGAVASVLLVAGGLNALQAAAVVAGFPFAVVCMLILIGLVKALRWDTLIMYRHNQVYRNDEEADHAMPPELPGELYGAEPTVGDAASQPAE
ncbi:BCCT family transporter [Donghicola eburneus]|uniref:Putative membrane protein n=1 Tax=Donghicola eburneus TaxID=393278 RepID=A0A1M4N4C4_9RHOB|nr:BCCT family transporter [Donghicola eburneus]MCI5038235.1 BCCT family transporter [Donghicola eburneus]SCM68785.1 putative membrane protein [Donghicola eburneus]SFQ41546.1 choline/glycine/proline betaine transport protein [Donghicola eburneus]